MNTRTIRIVLGVLVAAYALFSGLVGFLNVFLLRIGREPLYLPANMTDFLGVLTSVPWWRFALWPAAIVLYSLAAYRLLTGKTAAAFYGAALLCDLAFLGILKVSGAIHADPKAIDLDYVTAVITLVIGAGIWMTERRRTASPPAQP